MKRILSTWLPVALVPWVALAGCDYFPAALLEPDHGPVDARDEPDHPRDGITPQPDASSCPAPTCGAAGKSCWDVSAVFDKTAHNLDAPRIFSAAPADGKRVFALLNKQDSTFKAPAHTCSPYYTNQPKSQTWYIERKQAAGGAWELWVRGESRSDCGLTQPQCKGEIAVNLGRCWKIAALITCDVQIDSSGHSQTLKTYCVHNKAAGTVTWSSGGQCLNCCQCPEAASVMIKLRVEPTT